MNLTAQHYSRDLGKYYHLPAVQVSLTLVLSLFIMAIFIVFALRPTVIAILSLQKNIIVSKTTLQQLDTKVSNLQKASVRLDAIKPNLPNLNVSIPNNGANYVTLAMAVEQLSIQTGTQIESGSLGPTILYSRILTVFSPDKNQSVVTLPFTVRVTGSYPAVYSFLSQLLLMERIVSVDSVTITKQSISKTAVGTVAMDVGGSAYYLANEAQLKQALIEKKGTK